MIATRRGSRAEPFNLCDHCRPVEVPAKVVGLPEVLLNELGGGRTV